MERSKSEPYLKSKDIKSVLKVSDCELMHLRQRGQLEYIKKGNAYFYSLPSNCSILDHAIGKALIGWHTGKHDAEICNSPFEQQTVNSLELLVETILIPVAYQFSVPTITYGFTSYNLKKYIEKNASKGTAPSIDQHSSYELNTAGNPICSRGGAACDFKVENTATNEVARYIVKNLTFDRMYYYGEDRPLHVSINGSNPSRHLQVMAESKNGRRIPSTKAHGEDAVKLVETL